MVFGAIIVQALTGNVSDSEDSEAAELAINQERTNELRFQDPVRIVRRALDDGPSFAQWKAAKGNDLYERDGTMKRIHLEEAIKSTTLAEPALLHYIDRQQKRNTDNRKRLAEEYVEGGIAEYREKLSSSRNHHDISDACVDQCVTIIKADLAQNQKDLNDEEDKKEGARFHKSLRLLDSTDATAREVIKGAYWEGREEE